MDALNATTFGGDAKSDPTDRIWVEVGDSKQPDFKPQVKICRWDNEVNCSIRHVEADGAAPGEVQVVDGKVAYAAADGVEVHLYEKPDAGEDGGFEMEWVLPGPPSSNVLAATIQSKGLTFHYQPPELTDAEKAIGGLRAEHVKGSYAVYRTANERAYRAGGQDYRTGKAFHIYRPKATDARGVECWCDLWIEDGLLTVTVPQDYLDGATYPVVVDPTLGYTSVGGSEARDNAADFILAEKFTTSEAGTFSSISFYTRRNSSNTNSAFTSGIYNDNAGEPTGASRKDLGSAVNITSSTLGWLTSTGLTATFLGSVPYWLCHNKSVSASVSYDSAGGAPPDCYGPQAYSTPIPATCPTVGSSSSIHISLYATYMPAATTYNQSCTATLTSAGALAKMTARALTGAMASAGALLKQTGKICAGTATSAGALLKSTGKICAGTLTPAGALVKSTARALTATCTSSATVLKQTARALTGTLTSSATVVGVRTVLLALTGTLSTAGALTKLTARSLTAAVTPTATLVKQTVRAFTGTLTSSAALVKSTSRSLAGTLTTSGDIVKLIVKLLAASVTPAGALVKLTARLLTGALSTAAALVKQTARALTASVAAAAALVLTTARALSGTLTTAASLTKLTTRALTATLTTAAATLTMAARSLTATLTTAAALTKRTNVSLAGALTSSATLVKRTARSLVATLTTLGTLVTDTATYVYRILFYSDALSGPATVTGEALDGPATITGETLQDPSTITGSTLE